MNMCLGHLQPCTSIVRIIKPFNSLVQIFPEVLGYDPLKQGYILLQMS